MITYICELIKYIATRVGFLPGRKVVLPFLWEEIGFHQEENQGIQ